ncbi:hypothetical protein [Mesobacillus zeae]|uniref:Uncharacterized protein n=1 Tax=Mesobacillus zeae TaxID=1917180 RepID=A0A398B469_9BACI|nr:hypothetical protein [Mesobacillus zeae]RID83608.1 hypothetical protein D1970_15410 [Mesobacillus zeae]
MSRTIGFLIAFFIMTSFAYSYAWNGLPYPSAYLPVIFVITAIFNFLSIFVQRTVMGWYEGNVYRAGPGTINAAFKYFAILSTGLSYHIQKVLVRMPFIINKLLAIVFFIAFLTLTFLTISVFE